MEVYQLFIPFRFKYGHSKKLHNGVDLIICKVTDEDGKSGFGEAVPRDYVTGESCKSVIFAIEKLSRNILNKSFTFNTFKDEIINIANSDLDPFPSCALCALEGAILSIFAHNNNSTIAGLFSKESRKKTLTYTGSMGIGNKKSLFLKSIVYKAMGFKNFKIKVGDGGSKNDDIERVKYIKSLFGPEATFFADANCAWDKELAIKKINELQKLGIWAIEEPLKIRDTDERYDMQIDREKMLDQKHYDDYIWLKERSPIPIIADESLISLKSMDKIIETKAFDILNIRLSKCGGFILSSEMSKKAIEKGLDFSIGAMVAESPILANEGAYFGYVNNKHRYIQGFSHKALHKYSFAKGGIKLKHGAKADINNSTREKLKIDLKKLNKLIVRKEVFKK